MRLIDLDSQRVKDLNGFEEKFMGKTVLEWLDDLPTVDAVEVVRCKDCKYGFENYDGNFYCTKSEDLWEWHSDDRDWYCADGERREE